MASIYKRLSGNADSQSGGGVGANVIVTASVLPAGGSTSALQTNGNSSLSSIDSKTPALSGGNVPVTGPLTDAQLRASAVPVSITGGGDATAANQVIGNASLSSIDGKLTSPLAVTGTFFQATQPVSAAALPLPTGASTSANQTNGTQKTQVVDSVGNQATLKDLATQVTGTDKGFVTNSVLHALSSAGGGAYVDVKANPSGALTTDATVTSSVLPTGAATSANQATEIASLASIDSKLTSPLTVTGPLTDTQLRASAVGISAASLPLPTGAATETTVNSLLKPASTLAAVTTVGAVTSITNTVVVKADTPANQTNALKVDGSAVTQPVSGSLGRTWSLLNTSDSVNAVQSGTWSVGITGTPTVSVSNFPATQPVSGTVTANAGTGSFTVAQTTGTNLHTVVDSGTVSISGTPNVAVTSSTLPTGAATSALQSTMDTSINTLLKPASTLAAVTTVGAVTAITNALPAGTNTIGSVIIADQTKTTYSAATAGNASAATPTDIFTIAGSATKTVKVRKIEISGAQTSATTTNISLIKRSTANANNGTTTVTGVANDSANAAPTAAVVVRTANPSSLGTAVGTIRASKLYVGTTVLTTDRLLYDFTADECQPIVLRGTAENLNVNLVSTTLAGSSFNFYVEWTEE